MQYYTLLLHFLFKFALQKAFRLVFGEWPLLHVFEDDKGSIHEWFFRWKLDQFRQVKLTTKLLKNKFLMNKWMT